MAGRKKTGKPKILKFRRPIEPGDRFQKILLETKFQRVAQQQELSKAIKRLKKLQGKSREFKRLREAAIKLVANISVADLNIFRLEQDKLEEYQKRSKELQKQFDEITDMERQKK